MIRFKIINEINNNKSYREVEVSFDDYLHDQMKKEDLKFSDLELIFKDFKSLFEKGVSSIIEGFRKQSLDETINALAMTSPFSLEEKQVLLEAKNLNVRKTKIAEILNTTHTINLTIIRCNKSYLQTFIGNPFKIFV